ncbi:uncharacterized protein METZ01_LOCUS79498 [marine metagenome]|jgi:uncharacterized protein (DUF1501 family)|uniref:DUF1501 domain-containing protein n=1 Tax=marine metagenome TaxID=408172 RepID=A0A381UF98_9ZZZZ|tara:strand:+ start:561 stop:1718 length:1158 start_codon:yes stop_codon:yes gene_type:complete
MGMIGRVSTMVTSKEKSLVVVQLSGGNDYLNTVIPYGDDEYYDFRKTVHIAQDSVLPIDSTYGFSPHLAPIKRLFDDGKVAVINGVGYDNPNRSHFRSMDIWHTALPDEIGTEGWLGRVIREIDPKGENVLTGVNFGRGLPRALGVRGVPVASVGNLETYGLFTDIEDEETRNLALRAFAHMYGGVQGKDPVLDFLGQTGTDALKGADILRTAPQQYSSTIEYASNPIAQSLRSVAQVLFADLGTRVFYTQHGSFDTHSGELISHAKLWDEVSSGIGDFYDDLKEHGREDEVIILVFSEFGRRIKDNGSGTDHGSGGVAFIIGSEIKGGMYGQYPSIKEADQLEGDLHFNNDFRSTYSTIIESWFGMDAVPIVNGSFEKFDFVSK